MREGGREVVFRMSALLSALSNGSCPAELTQLSAPALWFSPHCAGGMLPLEHVAPTLPGHGAARSLAPSYGSKHDQAVSQS